MPFLYVIHLPVYPPSITYRAWAGSRDGFSLLAWALECLARRFGVESLIVSCYDDADWEQAARIGDRLGVLVSRSPGAPLLQVLASVAEMFPGYQIVFSRPEVAFAPSDLLKRVCAYHETTENQYTYVSDLSRVIAPEIADARLLSALGRVGFGPCAPLPREAILQLAELRRSGNEPPIRCEPFLAGLHYAVPEVPDFDPVITCTDAQRAAEALAGVAEPYEFEALGRWGQARENFDAINLDIPHVEDGFTRVLYLTPASCYSGAEESLCGLVEGLAEFRFDQVALVGMEGVLAERLRHAGCHVISANWNFTLNCENNRLFANRLLDAVRPDLVHLNSDPGEPLLSALRMQRVPIVAHMRTASPSDGVLRTADRFITVSDFVRRHLLETGVPADRIVRIYNGVDPQRFRPGVYDRGKMRSRFNLPQKTFLILMIARTTVNKRHDLVLDALRRLLERIPAHLVFAGNWGDADYFRFLCKQIDEWCLADRVTWLPFQEDIRQIEAAADVVVLCSEQEALARCVLEAMAMEIPVVVSDSGGTHELLEDGMSGFVITGEDPVRLAAALEQLARDDELRAVLGRNARRRIQERFSLQSHVHQVARHFKNIVSPIKYLCE
jgi:glycosyltransferase involved in cell wall biosynthesis